MRTSTFRVRYHVAAIVLGATLTAGLSACGEADNGDSNDVGLDVDIDSADVGVDGPDDTTADVGVDADTSDLGGELDAGNDDSDAPLPPARGPGLGNLEYSSDELFTPVGWVNTDTGVPEPDPDFLVTLVKPFGTNATYMHNGYLLTLVAPDSGGGPGGLLFYDVSNPRAPRLVNRVYDPHGTTGQFREAHSMGFSNFDGRQHVAFHTGAGVEIWDLNNVHDPRPLSRLALPGVSAGDYLNVAWQHFWQGNTIYVAGSTRGLYVVDASDPLNPVLADRGGLPNPIPIGEMGGFRIGPVFAIGNLLVVSSMDDTGGFATLDISDPYNPTLLDSRTRNLPEFYAICLSGGRIITAVRGRGAQMGVWDITDPFRIELVDDQLAVPEQLYCTTQDNFVFQGAQAEVVKIDVSEPGNYQIVGRGSLGVGNPDHGQVTAFGNLVYVGNDHGTGSALFPHQLEPDTTPPRVTMVHPLDGETLQSLTTRVGVVFSDNVELQTIDVESFVVRPLDGEAVAGRFTAQANVVNFEPDAPLLPETTYEVVVVAGGVEDWVGNAVVEEFRSTFTTAAEPSGSAGAPSVSIVAPIIDEVGVPITFVADVGDSTDVSLMWSFGDGSGWTAPSTETTTTHTYSEPGHYTVVVRATNGRSWTSASARATAHRPLPVYRAVSSAPIAYDEVEERVYTANRDSRTVTAVDVATSTVRWEVEVGRAPSSVAVGPDGAIWVAVRDEGRVVRLDAEDGSQLAQIDVGRASRPVALAADPRGEFVAVSLEATGQLHLIPLDEREPVSVELGPSPGGIAIDGSGTIWVSRFVGDGENAAIWRIEAGVDSALHGAVSELALPADTTTVDAEDRGRGVPNYLGAPAVEPSTGVLWVPATSANTLRGLVRDAQTLNHENTVRAIAIRLDGANAAEPHTRIDFNDRALPTQVALSPRGDWAWVTLQGSNLVMLLDAYTGSSAGALSNVGHAPDAVAVSPDGRTLFVHSFLSRTVEVFDVGPLLDGTAFEAEKLASVALVGNELLSEEALRGKRIFYNAADPRMSRDGYISCASCHLDGGHDGLTWDFTDRGEGLRNTIDLRGRAGTSHGPLHWTANFDEIQDFENDIRLAFGGTGFLSEEDWGAGTTSDALGDPKAGRSSDLDALAAYVASLSEYVPSPWRDEVGDFTIAAARGAEVFVNAGCASCHSGDAFTDSGSTGASSPRHDVGSAVATSGSRRGGLLDGFDTPTLRGLWATAPYLHDGSAATIVDVFTRVDESGAHSLSDLSADEIDDLVRYLIELQ